MSESMDELYAAAVSRDNGRIEKALAPALRDMLAEIVKIDTPELRKAYKEGTMGDFKNFDWMEL